MNSKKMTAIVFSLAAAVSVLSSTAFAQTLTAAQAKTIAEKAVPSGSTHSKTKLDGKRYEVKFYNEAKKETYEVDVSLAAQKIVSFDSERIQHAGSASVTLSEAAAKKVVTDEFPKADIVSVTLDKDDGLNTYEVRFQTDSCYGKITIHPQSGIVLERDIVIGTMPSTQVTGGFISYDQAKTIALGQVPGGTVTDVDFDRESGSVLYEVELIKDRLEYDIYIDAKTGSVLALKSEADDDREWQDKTPTESTTTENTISLEKAKQIALAKVPGATVKKCHLDYDDGRAIYEGELYKGEWEYDFEIDASTGAILEWDADYDD